MAGLAAESPFSLSSGDVMVRWAPVGTTPPAAERAELAAPLSAAERARLERFAFERDAWHYLVAHALLRRTLARCAAVAPEAWSFRIASGGRPEIAGPVGARRLRFSLSHTRGLAACAVCLDHAVGVDVEAVDASLLPAEVERRILAPSERAALAPLAGEERLQRLFALWTLKEACLKARGEGLAEPPAAVSFAFPADGPPAVAFAPPVVDDPAAWRLHAALLPSGHALAAAVRSAPGVRLRFRLRAG